MDFNGSSYPQAAAQQNPLQMLGQLAQTQNALNQNAQFQQQFAAKQALGPIIQASIDPQTGQPDFNKMFVGMAGNPATAFLASDFLNQAVTRQFTQQQTANLALEQEIKRVGVIGNVAGSMLQQGRTPLPQGGFSTNVTPEQLMSRLSDPDISRIIAPKDAVTLVAKYSSMSPPERYNFLQQRALQAMTAKESMESVYGKMENIKHGGTTTPMQQSPMMGTSQQVGGALNDTPTVGEKMTPLTQTDSIKGGQTTTPAYQVPGAVPAGGGSAVGAINPPAMGVPDASAAPPLVTDKDQGRVATGTPGAAPGAVPSATRVTGLDPVRAEGLKKFAEDYVPDLNKRVQDANQLTTLMSQVKNELRDFKPGSGTELKARFAALAQSMGAPQETVDRIANGSLGSVQAAQKLFVGIGTTLAGQLIKAGGGRMTQAEWAKFLAEGAPNASMDPRGLQKVLNAMTELSHFTKLEQSTYQKYSKLPGADPLEWQSKWSGILDGILKQREDGGR